MRKWHVAALNLALVGLVLALVTVPAWAADLATATPREAAFTPAPSPSPDAGTRDEALAPDARAKNWTGKHQFQRGLQVGDEDDGASLLTFIKRQKCTVNLPAFGPVPTPIVAPGTLKGSECTVTGAAVGDSAFCTLQNNATGEYAGLTLNTCFVSAADTVRLDFHHASLAGLDPGPLVVHVLVVR